MATLPFILESQRVLVDVSFERPDGGRREGLAWLNMGMARPVVSKAFYQELHIAEGRPLRLRLGGQTIEVAPDAIVNGDGGVGVPDFGHLFAPRPVEAMLPAGLFQQFVLTLDYGDRTLVLERPDPRPIEGVPVPFTLNPETGLITVAVGIDGQTYPAVVDAGSGYSWWRGDVVAAWLVRHPDWQRADGAIGQSNANMVDYDFEKKGTLVRLPRMMIGTIGLQDVGILGTGPILGRFLDGLMGDLFWDNWQKGANGPVAGWIGGNVLKDFRITIDYPNRMLYWRQQRSADTHELDQPGITLVRRDDRYVIGGVVHSRGRVTVEDVENGDELVAIDGFDVRGASMDAVLAALHGKPGERRVLTVERNGLRHVVETAVSDFD